MYTGHCRTLAKVSNGIPIGLTNQKKDLGNNILQIDSSVEGILRYMKNASKIMFRWCLAFDAVYISEHATL